VTHKIILINGPPSSGKDRAGMILRRIRGVRLYKMSRPIKEGLREFFSFSTEIMKDHVEPFKDEVKVPIFNGMTWREVQISLSEDWAKKEFGDDIFGELAVNYLQLPTSFDMTAITDTGFRSEVLPIVRAFGVDNCLLIQLTRKGCPYEGDSRSYLELDDIGVITVLLNNRSPLQPTDDMPITYEMQLGNAVRGWLGEEQPE